MLRVQDAGLHLLPENHMVNQNNASDFIDYLSASATNGDSESDRLPSLSAISRELGVSVARLREQLEVAKALGFV